MTEVNLEDRFPSMRPIRLAPSQVTFNGFGTRLCGRRDLDPETGTYVTTNCICALFVPILALRAYRVADAEDGRYFVGQEPLSTLARGWNTVLVAGVISLGAVFGWNAYVSSPDYRAAKQMADAEQLAASGQPVEAAQVYRTVILGGSGQAKGAQAALRELLDELVRREKPEHAAAVLGIVIDVQRRSPGTSIIRDPYEWGASAVERFADANARGAAALLEVIAPLVGDTTALDAQRVGLLERAVAEEPEDPDLASKLAVLYEARGELDKCDELLAPHERRLGTTEGARILGQSCARRGDFEPAFALLLPYVEGRLKQLHVAERNYNDAIEHAWERVIERLEDGQGPEDFYRRYEAADEAGQQAMVQEYVGGQIRDDPVITAAQEELMALAGVVPVALELGIVRLRRAQAMTAPQARQEELKEAERTFLAIRGLAGESDEFRLFLGQVYYWLGKHAEGRALFDELLAANQRDYDTLMAVCSTLRDLGAESEARQLVEEAYEKETDLARKYEAAHMRALIHIDLDDTIAWLERANPADISVKASLSSARGQKAMQEGRNRQAERHMRDAIQAYASQTQSSSALNNAALVYFSLFQLTGDRADFDQAAEMLEKAVALEPSDSILLFNAASTLLDGALMDIMGGAIDFRKLRMPGDLELLPYFYRDQEGRRELRRRVAEHPDIAKALERFDKVMVLAPKSTRAYTTVAALFEYTCDLEALTDLRDRIQQVQLDLADRERKVLDFYTGEDDETWRADIEAGIARFQKLFDETKAESAGVEFAIAVGYLTEQRIMGSFVGLHAEPDELVAMAQAGHDAAPSSATRRALLRALLFRAHQNLAQQDGRYAEIVGRAGRALHPSSLIAVALDQGPELRKAVLKNADVQSALSLVIEDAKAFPDDARPWGWAMLEPSHADEAAKLAIAVSKDQVAQVVRDIEQVLHPVTASVALEAYWCALIAGEEAAGLEILREYAARGVPMPFDVQ